MILRAELIIDLYFVQITGYLGFLQLTFCKKRKRKTFPGFLSDDTTRFQFPLLYFESEMIVNTVSFSRGHFKSELLEGSGTSDSPVSLLRSVADIHVQYTRIDSSRLRALTTRLSGSLVASGSGYRAYRK